MYNRTVSLYLSKNYINIQNSVSILVRMSRTAFSGKSCFLLLHVLNLVDVTGGLKMIPFFLTLVLEEKTCVAFCFTGRTPIKLSVNDLLGFQIFFIVALSSVKLQFHGCFCKG